MMNLTVYKKTMFILSILVITLCLFVSISCKTVVQERTITNTDTIIKEIPRDVPVAIAGDNGWMQAYFECDSLRHVKVKVVEQHNGTRITPSLSTDSINTGMLVTFNCKEDSLKFVIKCYDKYVSTLRESINEKITEAKKTFWEKTFGRYLSHIIALIIGIIIGMLFKNLIIKFIKTII